MSILSGIVAGKLMQEEQRGSERVKSFLKAQILFNNRMTTVDCIIKNISQDGAKIALSDSVSIPSDFDLYIPVKAKTYRAHMVWRDTASMGVRFAMAETEHQKPEDELPAADTMGLRLRALEMQNAELKTRIRELSKRLEDLGQDPELTNTRAYYSG